MLKEKKHQGFVLCEVRCEKYNCNLEIITTLSDCSMQSSGNNRVAAKTSAHMNKVQSRAKLVGRRS